MRRIRSGSDLLTSNLPYVTDIGDLYGEEVVPPRIRRHEDAIGYDIARGDGLIRGSFGEGDRCGPILGPVA